MATQASLIAVQKMYIAYYGRPADQAGLNAWADALDTAGGDLSEIVEAFGTSPEATARFGGKSSAETITTLYQQLFGRDPETQAVLDEWVNQLENNPDVTLQSIALDLLNGAMNDDLAAVNNKLAIAQAFTAAIDTADETDAYDGQVAVDAGTALLDDVSAATDVTTVDVDAALAALVVTNPGGGTDGATFTLTESTDRGAAFTGDADNNLFEAYLAQNNLVGGVSNTLSSADVLDGGAGIDTLDAVLVPEFFGSNGGWQLDVQPRTTSIENITIEARDLTTAGASAGSVAGHLVSLDAKDMTDIVKIGSKQSDGDLVIENLTTLTADGTARNTDVITVTMDHTDNFNSDGDASDLTVYFDEDYLVPTTNLGQSSVIFRIMNQDAYDQNDGGMRLDGVFVSRMEFELDGKRFNLADFIQEDATATSKGDEFQTEAELVAHLNDVALPALVAANPADAAALIELSFSIGDKWNDGNQNRIGDDIVLTASNAHTLTTQDAWIQISQAEDVPTGYASNRIERTSLETGADSEELSVNVELHKVGREGEGGDLVIGGKDQGDEGEGIDIFNISVLGTDKKPSNLGAISSTNDDLDVINIKTDASVTGDTYASLTIRDGFGERVGDLQTDPVTREELEAVNANEFKGDLTIGSDTDVLNLGTLNATGGGNVTFNADVTTDGNYAYNTGAGDDTIKLDVDTDATDRVDTSLNVSTGGGEDSVTLNTTAHASQNTMQLFNNMSVATGSGNDKVEVNGDGRYNIDAAAGDDYVYINSQGTTGAATGAWEFGRVSDAVAKDFADKVLYQATLTVVFAGLESEVTIGTNANDNFVATQLTINAAIEEAISQNPELAQLLTITRGDGDQFMTVTSNIDGYNELSVTVDQPNVVTANAGAGEVELATTDV